MKKDHEKTYRRDGDGARRPAPPAERGERDGETAKRRDGKTAYRREDREPKQREDFELVFGKNSVLEVIENGKVQVNKIWMGENFQDQNLKHIIISYAKEKKIPYHFSPQNKLNSLTNNQIHQGVVLSISPIKYLSVSEIIHNTKIILIAHEIEDVHNLGAMIRTFVAGGGKGVILTGRSNVGVNATVIKTSSGALFQCEFARATNCVNVLNELKENGFWIIGTDSSSDAKPIYEIDSPDQVAILVGNEHTGLGPLIKKNCDFLAKVPISDKIDSLNVSVAFGIVLFEILRQKNSSIKVKRID